MEFFFSDHPVFLVSLSQSLFTLVKYLLVNFMRENNTFLSVAAFLCSDYLTIWHEWL